MPSPFPGMDPYLESPAIWPDVHHGLISRIRDALHPLILPRHVTRIYVREYFSHEERVDVREAGLEIRRCQTGVTAAVIEVVSPANKAPYSSGWKSFRDRKQAVFATQAHWIEIDLLRTGATPESVPSQLPASDYRITLVRAQRKHAEYWPFSVRDPLPTVPIPLSTDDADVPLNLGAVFNVAYDIAGYDLSIDYHKPPDQPLKDEDAKWAERLLQQKRLR